VRLGRLRDVVAARQLVIARQPLPNRLGSTIISDQYQAASDKVNSNVRLVHAGAVASLARAGR